VKAVLVIVLVILVVVGGVFAWRAQRPAPQEPASVATAPTETLYLAVPMGVFVPMNKVMESFTALHPNVEFSTMVDTPETMAKAVEENDKKPDIFMSPGGHEATVLVEKGFLDPDSMRAFGSYKVAILVPPGNPGKIKEPADLLNPEVKVISFSPPDLTAASHAAKQSLVNLGLWSKIEPKVKVTGCCNESFQWVVDMDTKSVDLSKQKAEIACLLPTDTYYVPRNVVGILKTTEKRELAQEFVDYLTSPETLEMMSQMKLRNDQDLPLTVGQWGPAQEAGPAKVASK